MNFSDKSYERVPVENPDQVPAPNPTPNPVTNPTPDNQTKSEMKSSESSSNTVIQQQPTKQSEAEKDPPPSYPAELMRQPAYNYQQPGTQMVPPGAYPQPGMPMMMEQQMLAMMDRRVLAMQMMSQQGGGMPIMTATGPGMQTVPREWVPTTERLSGCPPGLEYLCNVDSLFVHQEIEMIELLSGIEQNNKYSIVNRAGQQVYYVIEDTPFFARNFGGSVRAFDMKIMDKDMTEVIHLRRDLAWSCFCIPCCLQVVQVYSPPGVLIGTVKQSWSLKPSFNIKNEADNTVLRVKGPFCVCACGEIIFQVLAEKEDITVGNICKEWAGYMQEMATNADNFNITFPIDLDVKVKALLLGVLFLIDFMYFEDRPQNTRRR